MSNIRAWLKRHRVAVLMGGPSAEREISFKTGRAIHAALRRQGIAAVAIDAGADLPQKLRRHKINFAYVALHGPGGEDGVVQGLLEWLRIPYTGSGVMASALAMDKVVSKRLFKEAGLAVADGFVIDEASSAAPAAGLQTAKRLGFPLVVKPSNQGSAIGVSIVRSARDWETALAMARRYNAPILVEKFVSGPEITVGILGDKTLPIIEIVPMVGSFYDFKSKYAPGGSRHILPARISKAAGRAAAEMSLTACAILGIRGAARVDLIVDRKLGPTLLEVNTIPGMTETSLLPDAARAAGISFDELVLRIAGCSVEP
jgi:D-alanine-D-alanine ligase